MTTSKQHLRVSLARYLVEAEEVGLDVAARATALDRVSGGRVSRQTVRAIRGAVGEIRRIELERRERRPATLKALTEHACREAARLFALADHAGRLRDAKVLRARLAELRRDHPLRSRAAQVVACSLEAYAGVLVDHAADLSGVVDIGSAQQLELLAAQLRTSSAMRRHEKHAREALRVERDRLLSDIEVRLRDVRAALSVLDA